MDQLAMIQLGQSGTDTQREPRDHSRYQLLVCTGIQTVLH